mgnify:CR=1 FL=1
MQDESGWLIEMKFGNGLLWWSGSFDPARDIFDRRRLCANMVNDAGKALRFSRHEDGKRVLDALLAMDPCPLFRYAAELYSVQEHLWPAPASKTPNVAIKPRRQASA